MKTISRKDAEAIYNHIVGWRETYEYFCNEGQTKAFQELRDGLTNNNQTTVQLTDSAVVLVAYALDEMSKQYGEDVGELSSMMEALT